MRGTVRRTERARPAGASPPFSLERISLLADGRVAHLLKRPRSNGATSS